MRVFISVDMEGIAGINTPRQISRGTDDYPLARQLMTDEASAAVAGAFDGGADHVLVGDSHGDMANILPDRLDPRAELIIGSPKGWHGMMAGIGPGYDLAMFVGYHARAGTAEACLEHSFAGTTVWDIRLNGESWAEADFNAAIAGLYGAPVGLITGDDKICAYGAERFPGITAVQVKRAFGRNVAAGVHPTVARERIQAGAAAAMRSAHALEAFAPTGPYKLELDVLLTSIADACSAVPGGERVGPRTVRFTTDRLENVFRMRYSWTSLGGSQAPRYAQ